MKALFLRHRWWSAVGFVSLLTVGSMGIHPFGPVKRPGQQAAPASGLNTPPQVAVVLKRACMDCHSNETVWPWYSYVPPVSWLLERDVRGGRDRMNLSEWHQYTLKEREQLLAYIASAVKNREMPLPQYTLIHHDAKLSDADTDLLYGWARVERRRIKAILSVVPANEKDQRRREYSAGRIGTAN